MILGAFAVSRIGYAAAGVRFDDSALHPSSFLQVQWQLLPIHLLRHDLFRSVWDLHSQPPLYNLLCGALLHLPGSLRYIAGEALFLCLGALIVITSFRLLSELGVNTWMALGVTLALVGDPAAELYENWLSWSYPTAAGLALGLYSLVRLAKTRRARWALLSATAFAAVVLLDATFQWPWLLGVAIVIVWASWKNRRLVIWALAAPLLLVGLWYVKDAAQFCSTTTSSWLGMNLYQTTLGYDSTSDLQSLVDTGQLNRLALVPPFQPVDSYAIQSASPRKIGPPAISDRWTEHQVPNFNNVVYIQLSQQYLHDDIAYIHHRPGKYFSALGAAARLWSLPADHYPWLTHNYGHLATYAHLYDAVFLLEPAPSWRTDNLHLAARAPVRHAPLTAVSWAIVGVMIVDLLVAPAVVMRRRKRMSRAWQVSTMMLWLTIVYSFIVTSTTEVGENMRFRFELGPLPLVLAAVIILTLMNRHSLPSNQGIAIGNGSVRSRIRWVPSRRDVIHHHH